MPLYIISHYTPLNGDQKDALAAAITKCHTELFVTPSIFVNVRFQDINGTPCYVGGRRKVTNTILAHVRTGPSRPRSAYDHLCTSLKTVWEETISATEAHPEKEPSVGKLDTVFILGDIVAGYEQGFMLPEAGEDGKWIKRNLQEFEKRASEGDECMRELVDEVRVRGLVA